MASDDKDLVSLCRWLRSSQDENVLADAIESLRADRALLEWLLGEVNAIDSEDGCLYFHSIPLLPRRTMPDQYWRDFEAADKAGKGTEWLIEALRRTMEREET